MFPLALCLSEHKHCISVKMMLVLRAVDLNEIINVPAKSIGFDMIGVDGVLADEAVGQRIDEGGIFDIGEKLQI